VIRVLVDTDLILEALLNRSGFVGEIQPLLDRVDPLIERIQMYVTDVGLQRIKTFTSRLQNIEIAEKVVDWLKERMYTCSIDGGMLKKACSSALIDFESAVELVGARNLDLDAIVTHKPDDFAEAKAFVPVWSVAKLWERLNLEGIISANNYGLLVKDLLALQCHKHPDSEVEELESDRALQYLGEVVTNELNNIFQPQQDAQDNSSLERLIQLGVSQFWAGDLKGALHCFEASAKLDTMNPSYLLGIARTYKEIDRYIQAFVFAVAALSHAEDAQPCSRAHSLIAGIYHELFVYTHRLDYGEEAINFYTKAQRELPQDCLPVWNCISTSVWIFRQAENLTLEEREYYLTRARDNLSVLKKVAELPESNWSRYKDRIIADAEQVFADLGDWWQQAIEEMKIGHGA
jgi:tetratricopeptide (TPR) repeat protein